MNWKAKVSGLMFIVITDERLGVYYEIGRFDSVVTGRHGSDPLEFVGCP